MVQIRAGQCKEWAEERREVCVGTQTLKGEGRLWRRRWIWSIIEGINLYCVSVLPQLHPIPRWFFQPSWICAVTRLHNPTIGEESRAYRIFVLYPSFFLGVNIRKNKQVYRQLLVYWFYLIIHHISSDALSPPDLTLTLDYGLFSKYIPHFCSAYLIILFSKAWRPPPSWALFSNDYCSSVNIDQRKGSM